MKWLKYQIAFEMKLNKQLGEAAGKGNNIESQ